MNSTSPLPSAGAFGAALRPLWRFGEGVTYLNNGSFGAAPSVVLEAQVAWRDRIQAAPSPFFQYEYPALIREAADRVARWLGGRGEDLVFVDNATTGVNAVLRSLPLVPGDEILITSSTYGAVKNAVRFLAAAQGARVVEAALSFPPEGSEQVVEVLARAVTPRTRLAVLDHIVSENALVLPVAAMARRLRARGVPVLVDGAHAPGQVPVDLTGLDVDWYVGNLYKWAFAPLGCAVLWARPERQVDLHPPVLSWGLGQGFTAEFDWAGTHDPSPWLSAPDAIAFHDRLGGPALCARNRALVLEAGRLLADAWGVEPALPPAEMIGSMLMVRLPGSPAATPEARDALRAALWREHHIEVPPMILGERLWGRISAQAYNELDDYRRLAAAVKAGTPSDS